jgi:WD40 repeat protein/uncharacterized protein YjbI with pentapeptide repeats/Mrp family chromosome partitioning ATPase
MSPESSHRSHVTTFYSFKGGVGRSLLLANVGARLASEGRKVLLWDLDVEAPGLHNIPALTPAEEFDRGFLEWLHDWQEGSRQLPLTEATRKSLAGLIRRVPELPGLSILPACGQRADFAQVYQQIDWHGLFVAAPDLGLNLFREALMSLCQAGEYDHVLIDSRTGLTDLGGNLVAVLPNATVLVGSYGHQNTEGLLAIKRALEPAAKGQLPERGQDAPPLDIVLVASPVPMADQAAAEKRREVWLELFKSRPAVEVPWDARLLFEERLLAISDSTGPTGSAYVRAADMLTDLRRKHVSALTEIERDQAMSATARDDDDRVFGPGDDPRRRRARGLRFEDRVKRLLELLGFEVASEQDLGGNKVDLVARKRELFEEQVFWVECKDHKGAVGKDVLEVLQGWVSGTEGQRQRARAMVVAQRFSPQALAYAKDHPPMLAVTPADLEAQLIDLRLYLSNLRRAFEASKLAGTYVRQRVFLESAPQDQDGVDPIAHGTAWASGDGRRLWLLLGDYGTGKSCFFKKLAYELAVKAEGDPSQPIPIAIDLKRYPNAISLPSLLQEHLRAEANWHGNPDILLHLLSTGRVVLLLDAFDEMGVAAAGRSVEEQFRQLAFVAGDEPLEKRGNRVLITCRTHFFRDQQQVKDTAEGRIGDSEASGDSALGRLARRFDAAIDEMGLFKNEQILEYLTLHLGAEKAQEAWAFIQRTYDLGRLAPRPVLLELIVKALPKLAADGDAVTAADLYRHYTDLWLEDRAGGALQTKPEQRGAILRSLAFVLWGRPERRIHHRELGNVLRTTCSDLFKGIDLDRVDFELRTAAFLTRTADGHYAFSHKSFLEYFYARRLCDAVDENNLREALRTSPIAPEVTAFLIELLGQEGVKRLVVATRALLEAPYVEKASENALRLAVQASRGRTPVAVSLLPERKACLAGAELAGEDLSGIALVEADLRGANLEAVKLVEADLSGALLARARLDRADLRGMVAEAAQFDGAGLRFVDARQARLARASLVEATLIAADLADSDLSAARFNKADLHGARLSRVRLGDADFAEATLTCATAADCQGGSLPGLCVLPGRPIPRLPMTGVWFTCAAFSPDGQRIATGASDKTARIWDAATGKTILSLEGHEASVRSVAFSPDGQRITTGSSDKTARIWDAATGKTILSLEGHEASVRSVAFSPDGQRVATGASDKTARIWDAASGKLILSLDGHKDAVSSVAFSPDGQRIATASDDKTARIWDAVSGKLILSLDGHKDAVGSVTFSPDGQGIATASRDKTARIWDAASSKLILSLDGHKDAVRSVAFSPDGQRIATASFDNVARIWDAASGKLILSLDGHKSVVRSVAFSPAGRRIVTASDENTARIWDAVSGKLMLSLEGHKAYVASVAFSPDGQRIGTGSYDNTARIWDASGKLILSLEGHKAYVASVAFSPDGQRIATASKDETARIWDAVSGKLILSLDGHEDAVDSVAFSPDGQRIATASDDKTARIWDAASGKPILSLDGHKDAVGSVTFSPDGQRVATASKDNTARIWDAASGKLILSLDGHKNAVRWVAFSPEGRRIATASFDNVARIWDAASGKLILSLDGHKDVVRWVAFSPDGRHVVTASDEDTARVWDAVSGKLILSLQGHRDHVRSVAFSPDGQRIATGSADNTARIWDANTGALLATLFASPKGWFALDAVGRWRAGGDGSRILTYVDPEEEGPLRTVWLADDFPNLRQPD